MITINQGTRTCCVQVDPAKWYVKFLFYLRNMLPAIGEQFTWHQANRVEIAIHKHQLQYK